MTRFLVYTLMFVQQMCILKDTLTINTGEILLNPICVFVSSN